MGRHPDQQRRTELVNGSLVHLAFHGLTGSTLRTLAADLDISLNGLMHHFGSRDDLVVAALRRSSQIQGEVRQRWISRNPRLSQADLMRRWWRWVNATPENLGLARLGLEIATLKPVDHPWIGRIDVDHLGLWRLNIQHRLIEEGLDPKIAAVEATIIRSLFAGLLMELSAGVDRRRLTRALEVGLARLEQVVWTDAGLSEAQLPPTSTTRHRKRRL